jgi:SAM-dependent methyltransferase
MSDRPTLERLAVSVRMRVADLADAATGRGDPLVPPRRLNAVGNSDFRATGDEFLGHFRALAGLRSSDRVLDVGCGIGRMARVLVPALSPPHGSYDGFDVNRRGIAWCRRHYTRTRVPFRFRHVDLHHPEYNPGGPGASDTFEFPYAENSFDLAIATSVFTHLLDVSAERYLAEIARVLAPGGRLLATWFLIDPDRPPGRSAIASFHPGSGAALLADPAAPEAAVAYPAQWVRRRLERHGLRAREPFHQGSWTGRPGASSQDILVADRIG